MVKLTERLVLARTRASDLDNVRKLNCWASDLSDISIIKKMQNVQIVSLSVNHIISLSDFGECMNLEELYIRKNDIANLAEIHYLCKLPRLRVLWLADNPCAVGDRYRMTVLKTLPNLQRLDNVPVQEEEVNEAIEQGLDLAPLWDTLRSSKKDTPDSSPAQIRRSKKFKEKTEEKETKKETEQETEKEKEKKEEVEKRVEKEIEEVYELNGGGGEAQLVRPKRDEDNTETDKPENIKKTQDVDDSEPVEDKTAGGDGLDKVDAAAETNGDKSPDSETPNVETETESGGSTEGSKVSLTESSDGEKKTEEKGTTAAVGDRREAESEDIEEGEVSIQETNEIRTRLGLKPLTAAKVSQPSYSRPSTATRIRNANILQAVLHLVRELDADSLQVVSDVVRSKLEAL